MTINWRSPRQLLRGWTTSREAVRRAFSLIELIVALALSVILISAIYGAISLHWRYETLGREQIDRSQLSLAIFRKLSEDVGSVMFSEPPAATEDDSASTGTSTTSSGTSSSTASTTSTTTSSGSTGVSGTTDSTSGTTPSGGAETSSAAASTVVPTSLGIVGTADYIQLDVSLPQMLDAVIPVDPSTSDPVQPASDLLRITWMLIRPQRAEEFTTGVDSLVRNPALARYSEDRLAESASVESSESDIATTSSDSSTTLPEIPDSSILAREIVALQFRYFDGYSWVTDWDSTTMGRLPRAIEVSMGFLDAPRFGSATKSSLAASVTTVKHVILVPASSPVSGSEL